MADSRDAGFDTVQGGDAALVGAPDARAPVRDWMNAPAGLARKPREVCSRTWEVPTYGNSLGFGQIPITSLGLPLVDDDGNIVLAGTLQGSFDYGTGVITAPRGVYATVVVALDGACNVRWSRVFAAAPEHTERRPRALGLDTQGHLVLVTSSFDDTKESVQFVTLDASGAVLAEKSIRIGSRTYLVASASRDGFVLFGGIAYEAPTDFGAGPISHPVGQQFNVLFKSDGTLLRQDLLGGLQTLVVEAQRVSKNGALFGSGSDFKGYYDTSFEGSTLAKIDATGKLAWKAQLYAPKPSTLELVRSDEYEDGSVAVWTLHGQNGEAMAEQRLRELAPDGASRWELPLARPGVEVMDLRAGKETVALSGMIFGSPRIGNTELQGKPGKYTSLLAQLERGGAVRWALELDSEQLYSLEVDVLDRVLVTGSGVDSLEGTAPTAPLFVRLYAQE